MKRFRGMNNLGKRQRLGLYESQNGDWQSKKRAFNMRGCIQKFPD
jgi:hypothetical protein